MFKTSSFFLADSFVHLNVIIAAKHLAAGKRSGCKPEKDVFKAQDRADSLPVAGRWSCDAHMATAGCREQYSEGYADGSTVNSTKEQAR